MGCFGAVSGQGNARSQHAGGVLATLADGSVHFVPNAISDRTWYLLLSRDDGQPVTLD
jgi:hypothetical protein